MASIPRLFYSLGIHIAETRSIGRLGDAIVFFMGVLSGMLEKPILVQYSDSVVCGKNDERPNFRHLSKCYSRLSETSLQKGTSGFTIHVIC